MTIIELNKKIYTVPQAWNELSQKQLLEVMETLFIRQYGGEQCLLKLFKIICNLSHWEFFNTPVTSATKKQGPGKKEEVTGMDEYLYLTEFLLGDRSGLTKQLLPCYDQFYGPDDSFDNLVMKEFVMSEHYYMQWTEDREKMAPLNELCGVLYRPAKENYDFEKNVDDDARIEYNQNLCNYFVANRICKWPMKVKLAIATWYEGCRHEMVENNDEVFGGSGGEAAKFGLVSVIRRVAKEGALGTFSDVENKLVNLVMIDMNESIAEGKAMEKAMTPG